MDSFLSQYILYSLYMLYIFSDIVHIILIILTIFISCFILFNRIKKSVNQRRDEIYEERTFGKVQKRND